MLVFPWWMHNIAQVPLWRPKMCSACMSKCCKSHICKRWFPQRAGFQDLMHAAKTIVHYFYIPWYTLHQGWQSAYRELCFYRCRGYMPFFCALQQTILERVRCMQVLAQHARLQWAYCVEHWAGML